MRSMLRLSFLVMTVLVMDSCQKETERLDSLTDNNAIPVAEAGPSRNITLPVSSATLNGSGNSANGRITGYLWSLVSGPNVPTIQTPSSPTTVISGMIAGNYNFQFMVIDSLGYTGVDTAWIRVTGATPPPPPVPVTLSLQPTNNQSEIHFWGSATQNQTGHATELDAGAWSNGGAITIRGAFKFDLSSIPAGATIVSAKLTLYSNPTPGNGDLINANSGPDNSFFIRRISTAWTAAGSTWANQPATTAANQVSVPHTTQSFLDVVDADVRNLIADMQTSGNNGFMIRLQNEVPLNIRSFCSSTYADASKHPKLVVVYQ